MEESRKNHPSVPYINIVTSFLVIFPWCWANNVKQVRSKSRKIPNKKQKISTTSCSKRARKGVMAVEEWRNENNRELSFFRDEGITNSPCSTDTLDPRHPHPPPHCRYLERWREEQPALLGKCVWKGERSSEPEVFLLPIVSLTTCPQWKKKNWFMKVHLEWQKMSDYQQSGQTLLDRLLNKNRKDRDKNTS